MEMQKTSLPWVDKKPSAKMIDVGGKKETHRTAMADGKITMNEEAFSAIIFRSNPKGDVLSIAEVAGIQAAKRTSDFIPLCHPISLDSIKVNCKILEESRSILVSCEVSCHGKTGVEMEALSGVHGALLAIYDLSKIFDPAITISDIKLLWKDGGKNGRWENKNFIKTNTRDYSLQLNNVRASVITLSDRVSRNETEDLSGPEIVKFLSALGCKEVSHHQIPDDPEMLTKLISDAGSQQLNLLITTGGTGVGPRDITPETIQKIANREVVGIGELLRIKGAFSTNASWLSRSGAWVYKNTLVIALPGSPKGAIDGCNILAPLLPHILKMITGGVHE